MSRSLLKQFVLATTLVASCGAHAALTTYAPWEAAYTASGLSGVLFDVNTTGGVTTAMGAHAYKNGAFLANDGVSHFRARSGTYAGPPAEANRANWSFEFAWNFGACSTCTAWLGVDTDFGVGTALTFGQVGSFAGNAPGVANPDSFNMLMPFLSGLNFNPNVESHTSFRMEVRSATGAVLSHSDITVDVPEPTSLALVGVALAAAGAMRRRRA